MKNLLLVLLLSVVFMSCEEKSWYEQGHVDPTSECTFIVNDSIQVVGKEFTDPDGVNDIKYFVVVNGEELSFVIVGTYHTIFDNNKRLFRHLEWEYNVYLNSLNREPVKCFYYEKR